MKNAAPKNIHDFAHRKHAGPRLSMVTCYDYWSARILENSPIDALLVGDSVAMVMHGFPSTLHADVQMMELHVAAVRRGSPNKFIVGDMPFLSFRQGAHVAAEAAGRLMKAGAQAVKLEGLSGHEEVVSHLVESGVPVMGHLGLTPQFIHGLGGYRVQGREELPAQKIFEQARRLQELGAFSLVLECVPEALAKRITGELDIPTIGIGAGPTTDGQILVLQDLLGTNASFQPKFVRRYADLEQLVHSAIESFDRDVKKAQFPSSAESYT